MEPFHRGFESNDLYVQRGHARAGYTTNKRQGTPKRKRKIAEASRKRNRR